jgi:predicted RNA-binding protein associated with RNAse of E/G family
MESALDQALRADMITREEFDRAFQYWIIKPGFLVS